MKEKYIMTPQEEFLNTVTKFLDREDQSRPELRDGFATAAMTEILRDMLRKIPINHINGPNLAKHSFRIADHMMEERDKVKDENV